MLTLLISSKKSNPLLIAAAVTQMPQNQNASAMQGRGWLFLGPGTWRCRLAPAIRKYIVQCEVWTRGRAGVCAELV